MVKLKRIASVTTGLVIVALAASLIGTSSADAAATATRHNATSVSSSETSPSNSRAVDWRSPVDVAARYVKALDPSTELTTQQLSGLITRLRAEATSRTPAVGATSTDVVTRASTVAPSLTYWNNTLWFGHWDVAWMTGLSAVAMVGILLTTGPIGVGTAWGIVGAVMGVMATAFFSGYCAYYVVSQRRGGTYRC